MSGPRRVRAAAGQTSSERGILSKADLSQRRVRWLVRVVHIVTLVFLIVVGLGPIL